MMNQVFENQYQNEESQEDIKGVISKKRERFQIEMRKGKRDEILNRRRIQQKLKVLNVNKDEQNTIPLTRQIQSNNINNNNNNININNNNIDLMNTQQQMQDRLDRLDYQNINESQKKQLEEYIMNPNTPDELLIVFKQYRYLLSQEIIYVADIPIILSEKLINMLQQLSSYPAIIYEVVQLLSLISSGDRKQVNSIVNIGGINIINNIYNDYNDYMLIQEQLVEIIGNIIADSQLNRDMILKSDIFDKILHSTHKDILFVKTVLWAISNAALLKTYPKYQDLLLFQNTFVNAILYYQNDEQIVLDSLLSLSVFAKQAKRQDEIDQFCSDDMIRCIQFGLDSQIQDIRERGFKILLNLTENINNKDKTMKYIINNKFDKYLIVELAYKQQTKINKSKKSTNQQDQQNQLILQNKMNSDFEQEELFSTYYTRKYSLLTLYSLLHNNIYYCNYFIQNYDLFNIIINAIHKETQPSNIEQGIIILESIFYDKKGSIIDKLINNKLFDCLYYTLDYESKDILSPSLKLIYDILSEIENYHNNGCNGYRNNNNNNNNVNIFNNQMIDDNISNNNNNNNNYDEMDDNYIISYNLDQVKNIIQDSGVFNKIIELQGNRSKDVSETSMDILDQFFPEIQ